MGCTDGFVSTVPSAEGFAPCLRPFCTTAQVPAGGVYSKSLLASALSATLQADARSILCIPCARPGTPWALQRPRARALLDKTVFIMPRDFIVRGLPGVPRHRVSDDWAETVAAAAGAGLERQTSSSAGCRFSGTPRDACCATCRSALARS